MTGRDAGTVALADALEWFHRQLDRSLPDACDYETPREYYRDGRGWTPETIEAKRLGYAPANYKDELIRYLFDRGHDRAAILSTGLFGERDDGNLYAAWSGRYVLPYLDEDGRPVFAISRATDPVHPSDWKGNKYDKLQVTRGDVTVEEPIYGLDTIRDGEPVLITEGIADAITAHQAGYPCLSPVTVQFKDSDREELLAALDERGVDRAYLIQDAERPTSSVDDRDHLTIQQFGPGVKGAVKTAAYLSEQGVEACVADLPRPGLEKVDLDDYLQDWSDDLTPLLASVKPVAHHPAYDHETARAVALDTAAASERSARDEPAAGDGDHSALFDLDICDVTGLSEGARENNPLGHHGDSEGYFKVLKGGEVAYEHKLKVAYNGLTYLLVDAGERRKESPNGRVDAAEIFAAWRHAKRGGLIPDDDPIPHRALQHVAFDHDHADRDDLTDGWKLPAPAYNAALETVREDYGVDPGRGEITDPDADPVAVLPNTPRETARTNVWNWQDAAARLGADGDTDPMQAARDRTDDVLRDAIGTYGGHTLVGVLPTLGKSSGMFRAAAETGEPITALTGRGHKEQYEQFVEWCDEYGLSYAILPSFTHDCPTARGDHNDEWRKRVMGWYNRSATAQDIHKHAERVLGRPLPCQVAEDGRAIDCELAYAWKGVDYEETDVLIGHYAHAHKPEVTQGRTVVLDEFPGDAYVTKLADGLKTAVTGFCQRHDALPFDDWTDAFQADGVERAEAIAWFVDDGHLERDVEEVFDDDGGHALAPLATFAFVAGTDLDNGWEHTDLSLTGVDGLENSRIVLDRKKTEMYVLDPPDLEEYTRGVVGLDGTATPRLWRIATGDRHLQHRPVLTEAERREYLRDGLGLQFVRTTEYIKPYTPRLEDRADRIYTEEDAALLRAIRNRHGEKPGLITTRDALAEYDAADDVSIEWGPQDGLGDSALVDIASYRGNILGSNEFAEKRVGAVIGSTHYGDGFIKRWGAFEGEAITDSRDLESGEGRGRDLSYGAFGDEILTHMREHQTLQAAMRFGRDGGGATVYVHTDTLPDWVPIAGEGRVLKTWSDGMLQVVDALQDLDCATTADVAAHPAVEIKKRQVFDHLEMLRTKGIVKRRQDNADGRRVVWTDGRPRPAERTRRRRA